MLYENSKGGTAAQLSCDGRLCIPGNRFRYSLPAAGLFHALGVFDQSECVCRKYVVCFTDILSCRIFTCGGSTGHTYRKCKAAVLWSFISEELSGDGKETLVYDVFPDR